MPSISIALVGESYYLCGPRGNNLAEAATPEFRKQFDHSHNPHIHHTYVALGEDDSSYIEYIDDRDGKSYVSYSLRHHYPELHDHLQTKAASATLTCVSLGENGHYFIHTDWGRAWNLPQDVEDHVSINNEDDPVESLWLGKDDTYLAQTVSGAKRWNFKGNYGSLDQKITYATCKVKALGMNLEDDRCYFLLFEDGQTAINAGRAQQNGRGLTLADFKQWANRLSH